MTGQTIRLQPGDYWWTDAPVYRVPRDCVRIILGGLTTFERRYCRPSKIAFNAVTGGALVEFLAGPGDMPPPAGFTGLRFFGIPGELDSDVPTGVIRFGYGRATLNVPLGEAPAEPQPPTSWDPTPKWQRDHETQWWGTYGNPLLRPTGI